MDRRIKFLILLAALVPLLFSAACGSKPKATDEPTQTAKPAQTEALVSISTPTPTLEPIPAVAPGINPLTGKKAADPANLLHRPLLVRYGNDPVARPPSGLSSAEVVFEELAEGGFITRITGVYLETLPEVVGPIRSARPAVIDMMQQLDAALVFAGASAGTHALLDQQPYPQYEHVGRGGELFFRSADKPSPHNLYIKLPAVRQRLIADKADKTVNLRGWAFADAAPAGSPAQQISIPYPGNAPVDYQYDAASGTYLRSVEGAPHTDALNKQQLAPANVALVYAEHKNSDIVEDSLGNVAILITLTGKGQVQIFRDGVMIEGTWERETPEQLMLFKDASGNHIQLKPGQTWIQIVPLDYKVEVK